MTNTKETKDRVIATVRTAINTPAPRLISFKLLSTLTDDETGYQSYGFEVNGVLFKTGWSDPEHYTFLDSQVETSALTIQDLKLLLWWLEESDSKVVISEAGRGSRITNNIVYILVREDNQAFLGAYATLEEAQQMAKVFRVESEILHWRVTREPLPATTIDGEPFRSCLQPGR
jgi:hypothetical protein